MLFDPDGPGGVEPWWVQFTQDAIGKIMRPKMKEEHIIIVVHHDSEERTEVKGYGPPGSYLQEIKYLTANNTGLPLESVRALVENAVSCEYYLTVECRGVDFTLDTWWTNYDH